MKARTDSSGHAGRFSLLSPLLFAIAHEILGSAPEADDVLQDSYLRRAGVDLSAITDFYAMRNPDKLVALGNVRKISRH